jgi:ubiquinone/menaquinone biosynthesis C-methylase UbiE
MKKSEHTSNKFYKNLSAKGLAALASEYRTKDNLKLIKHLSKKSDKILDLACGYGRLTIPLTKAGYDIIGIDLAQNLIREAKHLAKKQGLKVRFDVGSMTKLPYKPESFDKIFCLWYSFDHLLTKTEQVKALNEIYRVLKPGGLAFLEISNAERKKLVKKLKEEGVGADKRILGEIFNGVKNLSYKHSRKTLQAVCEKSKFKNFSVRFMNLHGRRCIIAELYK